MMKTLLCVSWAKEYPIISDCAPQGNICQNMWLSVYEYKSISFFNIYKQP